MPIASSVAKCGRASRMLSSNAAVSAQHDIWRGSTELAESLGKGKNEEERMLVTYGCDLLRRRGCKSRARERRERRYSAALILRVTKRASGFCCKTMIKDSRQVHRHDTSSLGGELPTRNWMIAIQRRTTNSRAPELEGFDHRADPLEPPLVPLFRFVLLPSLGPPCCVTITRRRRFRRRCARNRRNDEKGCSLEEDDFGRAGEVEKVVQVGPERREGRHKVGHDDGPSLQ